MKAQSIRRTLLFISFVLLPATLNYFSPYLIIDGLFNKVISGAFVVWAVFFISSLFFGRAACAYICPYGGLQLVIDKVTGKPLKNYPKLKYLRYVLGAVWAGVIVWALALSLGSLTPDILYNTDHYVSVDKWQSLIFYYVIVAALSLLPLTLGKRATCHYFCPMSILNIAGTKLKNLCGWKSLRLRVEKSKCVACGMCNKACPMSLNVMEMVQKEKVNDAECILCGECAAACKKCAVRRSF